MRPGLFFPFRSESKAFSSSSRMTRRISFLHLSAKDKTKLALALSPGERKLWLRLIGTDEAADVINEAPEQEREGLLALLDDKTHREVKGLLDYAVEKAEGLTNPRYARLRPQMSVDEAVSFLRRDARDRAQAIYYAYVTDSEERLLGVVSFRDLLIAAGASLCRTLCVGT